MSLKIFLDLEETIIESWDNPLLTNISKVKAFIHNQQKEKEFKVISIFSFAIWNDIDRAVFHQSIKDSIETALDVRVEQVISVKQISELFNKVHKLHLSTTDVISILGKSNAFFEWCKFSETLNCCLIDDVVANEILFNKDSGRLLETININKL